MMNTVFIVKREIWIDGVFETREKAIRYIKNHHKEHMKHNPDDIDCIKCQRYMDLYGYTITEMFVQ